MNTCGYCQYFSMIPGDVRIGACHGVPPTPLLVPGQAPNGQPVLNINMQRPQVLRTEKSCSLFKQLAILGAPDAVQE